MILSDDFHRWGLDCLMFADDQGTT